MHAPATELTDVDVGLDKLLGIAWQLVDDDTLTASASLMSVVAAKLDAARAAFADAVDRSGVWAENKHANAAAMLNTLAANRHPAAAKRDVLLARRLREMPHVTEALHGGHITADHARLLGECLHARFDGQFVDFEEELVARAMELSYDDFVKLVNAWKQWPTRTSKTNATSRTGRRANFTCLGVSRTQASSTELSPQSPVRWSTRSFAGWSSCCSSRTGQMRLSDSAKARSRTRTSPARRRNDDTTLSSGCACVQHRPTMRLGRQVLTP